MIALAVLFSGAPSASAQCPVEMAKLLALDGVQQNFGVADVAIFGDTAVIGSSQAGIGGVAYVFYRNEGGPNRWGQVARLEPAGVVAFEHFGESVAIAGDTIAVGAPFHAGGNGGIRVFERDHGGPDNWGEVRLLEYSNGTTSGLLGVSVAISGDTLIAGAPDEGVNYTGSIWLFERNLGGPGNWGEAAKLIQSDGGTGIGFFGGNVAIEGDTIVSGAYGAYHQGLESGAAYVFERNAGGPENWGEVQKLTASDFAEWDFFGSDVTLSDDTLVIASESAGGAVYIFERNVTWSERMKLPILGIGTGVTLGGDTLLVQRRTDPGSVLALGRDQGGPDNWGILSEHIASDGYPGNQFGLQVAMDGDTYIVGARGDDHGILTSGTAYVFAPTPLACPESYCAPGITSSGCQAILSTRGLPSATSATGFELVARGVQGQQLGLFFYGISGRAAAPWGDPMNGCTSTLCVAAPLLRCAAQSSGGTMGQCDGTFTYDLTAQWASSSYQNPFVGLTVQAQLWYRDSNNPCSGPVPFATTALSNAIEFVVGP